MFTTQRLFGPPAEPGALLSHGEFLERARRERQYEDEIASRGALGGYLVARLVERWLAIDGSDEDREGYRWQLESTRRFVADLDDQRAETRHLQGIIEALCLQEDASSAAARPTLMAFAYFLEHEARFAEGLEILELAARMYRGPVPPAHFATIALFAGRLNRFQAQWPRANMAYAAAEEAAELVGDLRTVFRSRLGRAAVLRGQGNLPAARLMAEAVIAEATGPELSDVRSGAYADLGAVLERQGLYCEALRASYEAFILAHDPLNRMRMLGEVGVKLSELGYYDAARSAFEIVLASNSSFVIRANARLELMQVESALLNRVAFERHRLQLRHDVGRMPPTMAVDFRCKVGVGFARFGQIARAREEWTEGLHLAEQHRLNEWYFRLEGLLRHLGDCADAEACLSVPEPAAPPAAVVDMAAGLRAYAEAHPG